ncbi:MULTISPECIES: hypothetical protein [Nocardia]|uniref:Uncharacterized protein n=1 Tax=Nocardia africana TaxID=134964 RepID=A0A378X7T3_9NOCA|nr:hypothetical protein [Nocardia africana]MCC3317956.1 hypothetical protein [Nocardia africana]SUA48731.1 Uncharacterised protein [Nocardia africana]
MTHATETNRETVADLHDEISILVARVYAWAEANDEWGEAEDALRALGLESYWPRAPRSYTVDLSELRAAIPDTAEIVLDDEFSAWTVGSEVNGVVAPVTNSFLDKIRDGFINPEAVEAHSDRVDVPAVFARWGDLNTAYPTAGRAEVEDYRRRTMKTVLRYGESRDLCRKLERCIRAIGLGDYLPPDEATAVVDIPRSLTQVEFRMSLNRAGEISRDSFLELLARSLALRIADNITMPPEVTD